MTRDQIDRLIGVLLPEEAGEFVRAQINSSTRKPHAKRYSKKYQQLCLSIYYNSPKNYKKMMKNFNLVSERTLQRLTSKVDFRPGINEINFNVLKTKINSLPECDRYCTLCLDEMSLKAFLNYNNKRDEVVGLEDLGEIKRMRPACSAFVGMLRGVNKKWKQPLFYFLVHTQYSGDDIKKCLIKCIKSAKEIGLKIVAIVSDMGRNFIQLSESLGVTKENSVFNIEGDNYLYIFDVPHLIKATRNNLMTNHFLINNALTSWKYVEQVYEIGKNLPNPPAPKLTESHINPTNFQRMKVKLATQVISTTVASSIELLVSLNGLSRDASVTSEVIRKFDNLFDMLNSSNIYSSKAHKKAFVGSDFQLNFLHEMKLFIANLKIIKLDKYNNYKDITNTVSFIKGWIITINSVIGLWNYLHQVGIEHLFTRHLNQDVLECFFGEIRIANGNALNPTPIQFVNAFKKLFFMNYTNIGTGNCVQDCDDILMSFDCLNDNLNPVIHINPDNQYDLLKEINLRDLSSNDILKVTDINVFTYICGYLVKKCLKMHSCDICERYANSGRSLSTNTLYCYYRAYDKSDDNLFGKLHLPHPDFIQFVKSLENLFFERFYDLVPSVHVIKNFYEIFLTIYFNHPCDAFPFEYCIKLYARVRFFFTLKFINRKFKTQKGHAKYIILNHN